MDTGKLRKLLAKDQLYEALAFLFHALSPRAALQAEEEKYRADRKAHDASVERARAAFFEDLPLTFANTLPLVDWPLAVLVALDERLWERHSAAEAPTPRLAVGGTSYWVVPRLLPRKAAARHANLAGSLQAWLAHHWVIDESAFPSPLKGLTIAMEASPDGVRRQARSLLAEGALRIFVTPFSNDSVAPAWTERWLAENLDNTEKRWESVQHALREAANRQAHLVVFPELTVCPQLRRRVQCWLDENPGHGFLLVLPGSFHELINGHWYNHAELLDGQGQVVLRHRKLTAFGIKEDAERIALGTTVRLLQTPLGLLATPICLDFCDERLGTFWPSVGAEWLLVPSYGDGSTVSAHQRKADEVLRAHATVTALANQGASGPNHGAGFVCHPAGANNGDVGPLVTVPLEENR